MREGAVIKKERDGRKGDERGIGRGGGIPADIPPHDWRVPIGSGRRPPLSIIQ
jgi:hypothetical protein